MHFLSPQSDISLHCKTMDMGLLGVSDGVPVYAITGTHLTYPRKDGQADFTWVVKPSADGHQLTGASTE